MTRLKELNLIRRAIRQRWPIPANQRGPLVRQVLRMLAEADDPRTVVAGFRALVEADKVNLASEAQALDWLKQQSPDDGGEEEPTCEIIVRTREEAAALLSALPETDSLR